MAIDLRKYFEDNVEKNQYYNYKFNDLIVLNSVDKYLKFDDKEIISTFKDLIYPYNENYKECKEDDEKFIYICFYLYSNNYYIKEFPEFIDRPTDRWNLSYDLIRNEIIEKYGYNGKVAWSDRIVFVNNLHIVKRDYNYIPDDINKLLKYISTRSAEFQEMSQNEKLESICNCIENLLKINDSFQKFDYKNTCGYLTDDIVRKFRNKLECFRHATESALKERCQYSKEQKEFMIEYGILILCYIKKEVDNYK